MIDAENLLEAKQKLVRQSIFLTSIRPCSTYTLKWRLSKAELLNFTRELTRLLKAGIPLYECLVAMEEKYRGVSVQKLLLDLCEQVRAGYSFSAAIATHPRSFDLLYVAMIGNAEKTGRLQEALEELATLLAKQQHVRKQLISATMYPALLFSFCLIVLGSLLFYVVPSLQELFEGRTLHPFTKIVFSVSTCACRAKFLILGSVGLFISSLCMFWAKPNWRRIAYRQILRCKLFNQLFAKVALIRFFRAASTLLEGGVPIMTTFAEAKTTMNHPRLEEIIQKA